MLDISRIDAAAFQLKPGLVSPQHLLHTVATQMRSFAQSFGVELQVQLPPPEALGTGFFLGDGVRLVQVSAAPAGIVLFLSLNERIRYASDFYSLQLHVYFDILIHFHVRRSSTACSATPVSSVRLTLAHPSM